jgi:PqqD family protein of HPr-rel-A system
LPGVCDHVLLHEHQVARWSATAGLVWTQFDDSNDWVVFNPFSGDIHLLSASAYGLWKLTTSSPPRSSADLIDALAADTGHTAAGDFLSSAQETLAFMDRAGLIAPIK